MTSVLGLFVTFMLFKILTTGNRKIILMKYIEVVKVHAQ